MLKDAGRSIWQNRQIRKGWKRNLGERRKDKKVLHLDKGLKELLLTFSTDIALVIYCLSLLSEATYVYGGVEKTT